MKIALFLMKGFVVIALFWYLYKDQSLSLEVLGDLQGKSSVIVSTILLLIFSTTLAGMRLFVVLKTMGIHATVKRSVGVTFMGHFASNIALGPLFSEAIRFTYLFGSTKRGWSHTITALLIDRLMGLAGMLIVIGVVIALFAGSDFYESISKADLLTFICIGVLTVALLIFISPHVILQVSLFLRKIGKIKLSQQFEDLSAALNNFKQQPSRAFLAFSLLILTHLVSLSANVYFCLEISNYFLRTESFAIATALAQLSNAIPITPAGLGVGEMVFDKVCNFLNGSNGVYGFAGLFLTLRILSILSSLPALIFALFLKVKGN